MAKTLFCTRIDHFFSAVAARLDLWRDLSRAAQAWAPIRPAAARRACTPRATRRSPRSCPWRTSRPIRAGAC